MLRVDPGDHEVLHRFVLRKKHLRPDGTVDAGAFVLEKKDVGRLSTFREIAMPAHECGTRFRRTHGCLGIIARDIRSAGAEMSLDISLIKDSGPQDLCPGHASIVNLPDPEDPYQYGAAERVASLLRDRSTKVPS